jgi:hypothetical protein
MVPTIFYFVTLAASSHCVASWKQCMPKALVHKVSLHVLPCAAHAPSFSVLLCKLIVLHVSCVLHVWFCLQMIPSGAFVRSTAGCAPCTRHVQLQCWEWAAGVYWCTLGVHQRSNSTFNNLTPSWSSNTCASALAVVLCSLQD